MIAGVDEGAGAAEIACADGASRIMGHHVSMSPEYRMQTIPAFLEDVCSVLIVAKTRREGPRLVVQHHGQQ